MKKYICPRCKKNIIRRSQIEFYCPICKKNYNLEEIDLNLANLKYYYDDIINNIEDEDFDLEILEINVNKLLNYDKNNKMGKLLESLITKDDDLDGFISGYKDFMSDDNLLSYRSSVIKFIKNNISKKHWDLLKCVNLADSFSDEILIKEKTIDESLDQTDESLLEDETETTCFDLDESLASIDEFEVNEEESLHEETETSCSIENIKDEDENSDFDSEKINQLGKLYFINGVYDNSFTCFKKASEMNNANGFANLGLSYLYGKGCKININKAIESYKKAILLGNVLAIYNLALIYLDSNIEVYDLNKAIELLKEAADKGVAGAQYELAKCYYTGNGVKLRYSLALDWLDKAIENGSKKALEFKKEHFHME